LRAWRSDLFMVRSNAGPRKPEVVMRPVLFCAALCLVIPVTFSHAATTDELPSSQAVIRGRVVDATGAAVAGAQVVVTPDRAGVPTTSVSNPAGEFEVVVPPGSYTVRVNAAGFIEATQRLVTSADSAAPLEFALQIAGLTETVSVGAHISYDVRDVTSATRTATPLRDVPQAISVVSSELIADQRMASMADVARYMPGVGFAQGEGNRDTPIIRGNATTSDFFVDGVRDDVQYFRDVYNVERVEALKGPNAMIFGRGGVGGVINRVTRQADWGQSREASIQFGSWDNKRITADIGKELNGSVAVRATGMYENSDSYRDGVGVERYGFNPTVAFRLAPNTTLRASYEYFHDERIADRGISSFNGAPVVTDPGTFFGDPTQSPTDATINLFSAVAEHRFNPRVTLRNRLTYGDYDKFYQNVFPGTVNAAATREATTRSKKATPRRK
jgi:catecholate siderophore receptor